MIAAHEVTDDELRAIKDERAEIHNTGRADTRGIYMYLARAVAEFCSVRAFAEGMRRRPKAIVFCGLPSDVQFADWLLETLATFVRTELRNYLIDHRPMPRNRISTINGFVIGCTNRISHRLNALSSEREKTVAGNGRELVLAKDDAIRAAMDGIKLRKARSSIRRSDRAAHVAGWESGADAQFARPVEHGGPALISGR
jgi:hypothetical protein